MTREEAIKVLERYEPIEWGDDQDAFDMAKEALNTYQNCVRCEHYYETEDDSGVKSHCKAHDGSDLISRQGIEWTEMLVADGDGQYHEEYIAYRSQIDSLPSADCDTCIYNVCNYNKVPWDSNGEPPHRIDPDGTAWVNVQGQDLDKVGRVILDNCSYAKTFYPDRPTGEWEETESDEPCWYRCSECARRTDEASDYCPNCGAKMKGAV